MREGVVKYHKIYLQELNNISAKSIGEKSLLLPTSGRDKGIILKYYPALYSS